MPTPAAKEQAPQGRAGYTIEPIRGDPDDAATRRMEQAWEQAGHAPLPAIPPPVVGWRLTLTLDGDTQAQRTFGGGEEGFHQAQRQGGDWLAQHGADGIGQWLASAAQASKRMGWDGGYRHAIGRRGF